MSSTTQTFQQTSLRTTPAHAVLYLLAFIRVAGALSKRRAPAVGDTRTIGLGSLNQYN